MLNGKNPDTLIVKTDTSYNDPGATATDDEDGDVTAAIVVSTNVKEDVVGHYLIYYTVEDKAGNVSERLTRVVEVLSAAAKYDVTYNCSAQADTIEVLSYNNHDSLTFTGIYGSSIVIHAERSGTSYVINPQTLITGTEIAGTITAAGTTLTINFSLTTGTVTNPCIATLKRRIS